MKTVAVVGEGTVQVLWDPEATTEMPWPEAGRVLDLWGNELPEEGGLKLTPAAVYVVR